jgi:2-polyprenyl-3-methyl-5-hydroxy-6-metoxy-1,4-benzoquinol methylase
VSARERSVRTFEADVVESGGYLYATEDRLSCRLANERIDRAMQAFAKPSGKRVIDIGCGDGFFSLRWLEAGAAELLGVDAAGESIEAARRRCAAWPDAHFEVADVYELVPQGELFDVAVVRCMLHHLYEPAKAIERICSVAREVVLCDPNGYNPVLKVIERVSPYHVAHEEKSFAPRSLDRWFEQAGGEVVEREFIGLVPMFSPDWLARSCKVVEPLVEVLPGLRAIGRAQYVQLLRPRPA